MSAKPSLATTQHKLPFTDPNAPLGVTFRDSKVRPIHRWYPYVEGFSADYVRAKLTAGQLPTRIYDPFGGAGTTTLEASILGIPSYFAEVNPFMAFIARTKVNATKWACQNIHALQEYTHRYLHTLSSSDFRERVERIDLNPYYEAFPDRDFFEEDHLKHLIAARELVADVTAGSEAIRDLFLLAIAANVVSCSNMTRRADLRRRRDDEYKTRVVKPVEFLSAKINEIVRDICTVTTDIAETTQISTDARAVPADYERAFSLAITSPPYLNGTNYFRNTKLELWFLGFIKSEDDLKDYYRKAVAGGINNVSKDTAVPRQFAAVEEVAKVLDQHTLDNRIPKLVRSYFSDMFDVFSSVWKALENDGRFIVDIGDSKFYGVHVPTDKLLINVAEKAGFKVEAIELLARRHSRDKSPLHQVEITFKKPSNTKKPRKTSRATASDVSVDGFDLPEAIEYFRRELPYKKEPYASKTWGDPLHSLCSYQGKLKPALAYWLVKLFSRAGMTVLDPLGGVGTIGLEARLQGRSAVSNDLSPLAAVIAQGKITPPEKEEAMSALRELHDGLDSIELTEEDLAAAEFGLNATVTDYFHPDTLTEVLKARKFYLNKKELSNPHAFVKANLLHILHGNRPYALSRKSHSLTPYSPSGEFEYKSVVKKLEDRIGRLLHEPLTGDHLPCLTFNKSFRDLRECIHEPVDRIITSPPFVGMRFDRPNWMRLWFCGWQAKDFHATHENYLERQQLKSMDVYVNFFDVCADLLKESGILIMHIGGSDKYNMLDKLVELSSNRFRFNATVDECVADVERHGIRDKGTTSTHHFLFLQRS
jgi:DNA modification methylase